MEGERSAAFTPQEGPASPADVRGHPRSVRQGVPLRAAWLLLGCLLVLTVNGAEGRDGRPLTGKPWLDMDYGPFLTASIEAAAPRTNLAYKGLAIRLAPAFGGERNEAVLFDTDLLRYAAGWTGDFVALKGVVFDGEHWAYPQVAGQLVFSNPMQPGWSQAGRFSDPRELPFGPLPRDWAKWRGLYLHGEKVVLAYTVGGTEVRELPGLESCEGRAVFSRTMERGAAGEAQEVQLAYEPGWRSRWLARPGGLPNPVHHLASDWIAVLEPPAAAGGDGAEREPNLEAGLRGRWDFERADADGALAGERAESGRWRLDGARRSPEGRTGGGLRFDGRARAVLEGATPFAFGNSDGTVAVWMRTDRDGTLLAVAPAEGNWVPDGKAWFVRDGRLTFDVGWVGAVNSSRAVADGEWHHVAFTWSHAEGRVNLYVDGEAEGSAVLRPRGEVTGSEWRLGFTAPNFPASPWFAGELDELRVYGRALSAGEMAALAGVGRREGVLALAVVGGPREARWVAGEPGHVRLELPASGVPGRFKVLLWRGPPEGLAAFVAWVEQSPAPTDLGALCGGGPARWPERLETRGRLGPADGPYAVDTLTTPDDNPWHSWLRFGGLDFFSDADRAAVCTWNGDVWVVDGVAGDLARLTWQRVATGLFQPLGLKIVRDQIYVLGRDQITRLHDLDGDGEADWYENFNNDCQVSEHFHEFATDLQTDAAGNFYYLKCARHALPALHAHHGTLLKLPPDGSRLEVVARGFRAVNGLGVGPRGELTCVDNQGHWMPGNRLNWVEPGGWYGNQWAWNPEARTTYDEPLAWMHNFVDRSGGSHRWVPDNRWGPLQDRLLTISYGMGHVFLVLAESVDGVRQGGVTRLPLEFDTGVMRGEFHPGNGQLYVAGLYGWAGNKTRPGGVYRVRATGLPLHLPETLHVAADGLVLGFTTPLDAATATDPGNYDVTCWNYVWSAQYGSPDLRRDGREGRDRLPVESATLSADRRSVFLKLPGLEPVMQMHVTFRLRAADGTRFQNFVHHTVHRLGAASGRERLGGEVIEGGAAQEVKLAEVAAGLWQELEVIAPSGASPDEAIVSGLEARDTRVARLPALWVAEGSRPTPFLPADRFRSVWSGYLQLPLNEERVFRLVGSGAVTLEINGQPAIQSDALGPAGAVSVPMPLRRGPNRFELRFDSPANGEAEVRLEWAEPGQAAEPVPSTVFVREPGLPAGLVGATLRQGRGLFLRYQCVQCHRPESPWPPGAAPELSRDAPALDGLGSRLQEAWLASFLTDPRASREEVLMPRVLRGTADGVSADARDLAAFLATLRQRPPGSPATQPASMPAASAAAVLEGRALFDRLGCVACHVLEGEVRLAEDTRLSLGLVPRKWQPAALMEFLENPGRDYAWTRMPHFQLARAESGALAALLLGQPGAAGSGDDPSAAAARRGDEEPGRGRQVASTPGLEEGRQDASTTAVGSGERMRGDPERGSRLIESAGCLDCHGLTGRASSLVSPGLLALAESLWTRGCLGDAEADRGRAPDFGFTDEERRALREWAAHDWPETLQQETPAEFAERHYAELRCDACHARDAQPDFWSQLTVGSAPPAVNVYEDDEEEGGSAGSVHLGRPELTWAGEKLHADWMQRLLTGQLGYRTRPDTQGRMPAFPAYGSLVAVGLAHQHGVDGRLQPRPAADSEQAAVGRQLIGIEGGFACVSCHDLGTQAALAGPDTATINLAYVTDRLRSSYYWRYLRDPQRLRPGTMMPSFIAEDGSTPIRAVYEGQADRQFEAIWQFLLSLRVSGD